MYCSDLSLKDSHSVPLNIDGDTNVHGAIADCQRQRKIEALEEQLIPLPLRPLQTSHVLPWGWTWASAFAGKLLTAWAETYKLSRRVVGVCIPHLGTTRRWPVRSSTAPPVLFPLYLRIRCLPALCKYSTGSLGFRPENWSLYQLSYPGSKAQGRCRYKTHCIFNPDIKLSEFILCTWYLFTANKKKRTYGL